MTEGTMTFEMWIQRFVGAYQAYADCDEEDAIEAAKDIEPGEVDPENDCPVDTAKAAVEEDFGADSLPEGAPV